MREYLSTSQVADELGVSRDSLNAAIKSGTFAPAEALIGGRYQGWSAETIDAIREERDGGKVILCSPVGVAALITDIRRAAEIVRSYGYSTEIRDPAVYSAIPRHLLMLAARLDSEMRRITVVDHIFARAIATSGVAEYVDEGSVEFNTDRVAGVLPPVGIDHRVRAWRLREAAGEVARVVVQLPEHLKSGEARLIMRELGSERDKINDYAQFLESETANRGEADVQ
ncbi:MAG: hypothetical protein K2Y33_10505 [Mycolicibacterium frederiksbergense]|nr:hypothetical protein [Mycolicibacterium frederiksbergense]